MKRKISITTIAEELGVSVATVSRALNDSPKISAERRREIKEFAREAGFSLRSASRRTTSLCVLACITSPREDVFSTYTAQAVAGAARYCSENGLELSVFSQTHERLDSGDPVKELLRRGANGVVVLNAHDDSAFIGKFEEERLPYRCMASVNTAFPGRVLAVDNRTPARQATEHLLHLGHRQVAFVQSDPHNQAHRERLEGYKAAMAAAGQPALCACLPAESGIETGFETTLDLMARHPATTAIFAASDDLCDGVRAALFNMRLRIPEDFSLIGCDDSVRARFFAPPLTVIDIPNEQLGHAAARLVHAEINGEGLLPAPAPEREPWAQGRFVIRQTTAPPRP